MRQPPIGPDRPASDHCKLVGVPSGIRTRRAGGVRQRASQLDGTRGATAEGTFSLAEMQAVRAMRGVGELNKNPELTAAVDMNLFLEPMVLVKDPDEAHVLLGGRGVCRKRNLRRLENTVPKGRVQARGGAQASLGCKPSPGGAHRPSGASIPPEVAHTAPTRAFVGPSQHASPAAAAGGAGPILGGGQGLGVPGDLEGPWRCLGFGSLGPSRP